MPTAPANPHTHPRVGKNVKQGRQLQVRTAQGRNPTAADERSDLRVTEIRAGIGSNGLPFCEMVVDIGIFDDQEARHVQDLATPSDWHTFVEVYMPDDQGNVDDADGKRVGTLLHWGEFSINSVRIEETTEGKSLVSRVEPRHFGNLILGPIVLDADSNVVQEHTDLVFNVQYDRKVYYNKSSAQYKTDAGTPLYNYFLDPFSAANGYAITSNGGQSTDVWTLADAIKYLCYTANDEAYIDNPSLDEIDRVFNVAADLRGFRIRKCVYLNEALDQICQVFGYSWYLAPTTKENSDNRIQIKFFRFGQGEEVDILLQPIGEELDLAKTNCLSADLTWNVADIANVVHTQGGYIERECTFELYPGFPETDDGYSADELEQGANPASIFDTDPTKRDAWRRWVLNEGGDYTGMRSLVRPITAATLLNSVFGVDTVIKRRRFHDCLAMDRDRMRIDPVVEWWNPAPADGSEAKWQRVPWSYHLLHHECGIYFSGDKPPAELIALGIANARIRITAVIRGDKRIEAITDRRSDSPNGEDVILYLDNHDWFADRRVIRNGTYASALANNSFGSDEMDNTEAIKKFSIAVRDQEDAARLSAQFTLHDFHPQYELGKLVTKIEGRNISLDRFGQNRPDTKFLQITEVSFQPQTFRMAIRVETLELLKRNLDTGTI